MEKSAPRSELVLRRPVLMVKRASCWSGSQSTAAEGSGIVLSSEVNEECILVMLSSLNRDLVSFARVKTESVEVLVGGCSSPGPDEGVVRGGALLMTPGELGGVGVMTLLRLVTSKLLTSYG